ncbi:protein FAR1-RELATED SEQUENCE 5-like [Lactuca sativa]|uniref:protein FAR1-RELATED SEQUENCE 5-like n=1 Tax=Lactuca sativa TaxID=4236 RepID=UPI0022AE9689|nr:protein FAR1-RELATED SEQUENCE 5-like [Lactuca sativa]
MDLSFSNEFDDIIEINEEDEINDVQSALVDDDFLSGDDDFCSNDHDNPSIGKVDIMDDHNIQVPVILHNFVFCYNTIKKLTFQNHVTDIELCKERKDDYLDQHLVIADMYKRYACAAGFDVRKSTNKKKRKIVYIKYLLCNREGFPNTSPVDTLDPKIKKHNYPLLSRDNMLFSRHHRQLDDTKKSFILTMSNQNIGATIAHRLYTSILRGYKFVGGLIDDFKKYMRDLNCFIGGSDTQMLVDKLNNRKENLNALFWADETSKINYKEFGDVVSFDATFRTNMLIDNHKRCVTFVAGLLSTEDTDSYIWLLKSFPKAFGKQPLLVLSDQDPAMKKAIETVFPESIHRLCMWHITSKLPLKVSLNIFNNPEFRKNFNFLIWNYRLEGDDFEVGWKSLLNEYKLTDNKWLDDMHGLIHFWFKHVPLLGLMRTTSHFEIAMEKQRLAQSSFDFKTNDKHPTMRTPFEIERNASMFYTRTVFRQVQNEMSLSMKLKMMINRIYLYVSLLTSKNHTRLTEYLEEIKQLEAKFLSNITTHEKGNKNKDFEKTLGVTIPTSVDIHNPGEIRNKGSGTKETMKSSREVATEKSKGSRCSYCRKGNDHDWRNCPVRKEDEKNNIFKERPGKKN